MESLGADLNGAPPLAHWERFRVEECLGSGGMAQVYKAFDPRLNHPVALKVLDLEQPSARRRFLREARILSRIDHENVIKVYESGVVDDQLYMAMQYVEGPDLMALGDEIALEEKVRLLAQVADALDAAHRQGLMHRDVKPSNVLVERQADGELRPYLTDFGLAKGEGDSGLTAAGFVVGTLHYVAPEVVGGDTVDQRSDVFSLGATMYQVFSGELPFPGKRALDVMTRVCQSEPRPLGELVESFPPELEAVVMKCLAKNPARRYPSAARVAKDLRRYLDRGPVAAYVRALVSLIAGFLRRVTAFRAARST